MTRVKITNTDYTSNTMTVEVVDGAEIKGLTQITIEPIEPNSAVKCLLHLDPITTVYCYCNVDITAQGTLSADNIRQLSDALEPLGFCVVPLSFNKILGPLSARRIDGAIQLAEYLHRQWAHGIQSRQEWANNIAEALQVDVKDVMEAWDE